LQELIQGGEAEILLEKFPSEFTDDVEQEMVDQLEELIQMAAWAQSLGHTEITFMLSY